MKPIWLLGFAALLLGEELTYKELKRRHGTFNLFPSGGEELTYKELKPSRCTLAAYTTGL